MACEEKCEAAGIFVPDAKQALLRIEQGFKYLTIGMECALITKSLSNIVDEVKSSL